MIDMYQKQYPHLSQEQLFTLIAHEGFLRRMSDCYEPFMLKGSFVSRTYFPNRDFRIAKDLDFVYFGTVKDTEKTEQIFTEWADKITQKSLHDGIRFNKFSKHDTWQNIEYQMHQDFPTVNGLFYADVFGHEISINIDISFNLELFAEPVEILYHTATDLIYLPYSVPLSLQIAWKIHQCIINPRFKDFYDLTYLIPLLTRPDDIKIMLQTLQYECQRDHISIERIRCFFEYQQHNLFTGKYYINGKLKSLSSEEYYDIQLTELKTYCTHLPKHFDEFWHDYIHAIKNAEFNRYLENFIS